ncbi:MAG: MoaD/ThiS family protein [Chloroflexota bacterium]
MAVTVRIPVTMRRLTGGIATVQATGATVAEVIANLDRQFPGLREKICAGEDCERRLVNIYVDGEDIRFREQLATRLPEGAEVMFLPIVAGG